MVTLAHLKQIYNLTIYITIYYIRIQYTYITHTQNIYLQYIYNNTVYILKYNFNVCMFQLKSLILK